jgi:hypothetical protein
VPPKKKKQTQNYKVFHLKDYRWLKLPTNDCPPVHKFQCKNARNKKQKQDNMTHPKLFLTVTNINDSEVDEISKDFF